MNHRVGALKLAMAAIDQGWKNGFEKT